MSVYVETKRGNKIKKIIKNTINDLAIVFTKIVATPLVFLVRGEF